MSEPLTPERISEIESLLRYETSTSFHSARTKESMLLLVAEVERLRGERDALKDRLHRAAMTRTWRNEDGKKFVFVEDIVGPLLGRDDAGRAE